jgi:hypothetical protein
LVEIRQNSLLRWLYRGDRKNTRSEKLRGLTQAIRHLYLDQNRYFGLFDFFLTMLNISSMGP